MNTKLEKEDPGDYLSLEIDGADKKNYTLLHFSTHTRDKRGHGSAVHLMVVLKRAPISQLRLYKMTDEHETGSNHILDTNIHVIYEIV